MVEWTAPDTEGRQGCPAHPDVPRFYAAQGGCPDCRSQPSVADDVLTTEMVEADIEMDRVDALDADVRGLPDMLELEELANKAQVHSRREMNRCRKLAGECEGRARQILDGEIVLMTRDREGQQVEADSDAAAVKWMSLAKDFRMVVQKSLDTQAKLIKANLLPASARYRAKKQKQLIELKAKGRAN